MYVSTKNKKPFGEVCDNDYGRKIIKTYRKEITIENIVDELEEALPVHNKNAREIDYLDRYYRGDQPILYRVKEVRPEINERIVVNHAYELVESKTAENVGEPIQYVLRGVDEKKSDEIKLLNSYMMSEDKDSCDITLCRWRSICGTAYRFVANNEDDELMDETPFEIRIEDPRLTFVAYSANTGKKMYSCQIRLDEDGDEFYWVYTKKLYMKVKNGVVEEYGINGNNAIPVVEYPNNERRLSDIELTALITDAINSAVSDRLNGIEQFIQALMKFKNCEIDKETFEEMKQYGAITVKDYAPGMNSDVNIMTAELNQEQTQIVLDDLYNSFLMVHGKANRQQNTGGDTGQAVYLRNGGYEAEKRAQLSENIFKKSEREFLKLILTRMRISNGISLAISDIEIKIIRDKSDNMMVKAETLKLLVDCGVEFGRSIKTVGLWVDPEEVANESRETRERLIAIEEAKAYSNQMNKNASPEGDEDNVDEDSET